MVGLIATGISIISVMPQVYQVIRTDSTKDISIYSTLLMIVMSALWIWYGVLIMNWPVILTDVGVVLQEFVILAYKIKHLYFSNNDQEE